MNIQVTQEDIWNGKRGCGRKCAVALAVRRGLIEQKKDLHPYIESDGSIDLYHNWRDAMPSTKPCDYILEIQDDGELADVQAFIYDFDEASTTHPINFNATIRRNK
tara:strand:+ start:1320 stop:1637 length:318 start_codon:yes stop_codon:yes gene_type:complete